MEKINVLIICLTVLVVCAFATNWVYNLSHSDFTMVIDMDDETRDYLMEHDYCIYSVSPSYNSNDSSFVFLGDCQYLNKTIAEQWS